MTTTKSDNLRIFDRYVQTYTDESYEADNKKDGLNAALRFYYRFKNVLLELDPTIDSILGKNGKVDLFDFGAYPATFDKILKLMYKEQIQVSISGLEFNTEFINFCNRYSIKTMSIDDIDHIERLDRCISYDNFQYQKQFNIAMALNVIEHFYNPINMLDLINVTLKHSAIFILTTDNITSFANVINILRGESVMEHPLRSHMFYFGPHRPHIRTYSKE